jgi:hypothetical protein
LPALVRSLTAPHSRRRSRISTAMWRHSQPSGTAFAPPPGTQVHS